MQQLKSLLTGVVVNVKVMDVDVVKWSSDQSVDSLGGGGGGSSDRQDSHRPILWPLFSSDSEDNKLQHHRSRGHPSHPHNQTMQYNTINYNTLQYNTTRYNSRTQHSRTVSTALLAGGGHCRAPSC